MFKKLLVAGAAFTLLVVSGGIVRAQDGVTIPDSNQIIKTPPVTTNQPFLGEDQRYSVVFRGNGEAIVTLRVTLSNKSETDPLSKISLRFPNVEPRDISVYQILGQGRCIIYDLGVCTEYGPPDYYSYYGNSKYQKASYDFAGDTVTITLPNSLKPQGSGSFFLYFRTFGYAKKNIFGAYNYVFETLKVDDQIHSLTLGITTDSDLYLKGVKGKVQYRNEASDMALKSAPTASMGAISNPTLDNYVSQIGSGQITKSVSNLAALESYKVNGSYADSWFKLYAKGSLISLAVFLFILLSVVLVIRFLLKKRMKENVPGSTTSTGIGKFLIMGGVSFATSLVIAGLTIGFLVLVRFVSSGAMGYDLGPFLILATGLLYVLFSLALLVIPGIYIGFKKGVGWGVGTVGITLMFLFIYLIIGIFVSMLFTTTAIPYNGPIY